MLCLTRGVVCLRALEGMLYRLNDAVICTMARHDTIHSAILLASAVPTLCAPAVACFLQETCTRLPLRPPPLPAPGSHLTVAVLVQLDSMHICA